MALSGKIIRRDQRPLGDANQVKVELNRYFPGVKFILIRDTEINLPGGLSGIILRLFKPRYPYWEGIFEAKEFIAVFQFAYTGAISRIELTLYGRGTLAAKPYFDRLSARTGWLAKF